MVKKLNLLAAIVAGLIAVDVSAMDLNPIGKFDR